MMKSVLYAFAIVFFYSCRVQAQVAAPAPCYPIPTSNQLEWHALEQYAFVHFSINTFTGKEWGFGNESPALFNPEALDAGQWARVFRDAGLKGIILTCKHHDGFCLWPSRYTRHSVSSSPFRDGKGDVVREVADACREYGLKFGIYLSPWDRNHADYGNQDYLTYYRAQLKELFENYGPVFEMWFDGAMGGDGYYGGKNEKRTIRPDQYYEWPATLKLVRDLEPDILFFSDAGPDIRWCGNESGYVNETHWYPIHTDTLYAGKSGISALLGTGDENGASWVPAEADVSIRPGWFYHAAQDSLVKSPHQLFDIYLSSVGRGSNLLLNIPPDRRGLIHDEDVKALKGWKQILDSVFRTNLAAPDIRIRAPFRGNHPDFHPRNLTDNNPDTYWATDDNEKQAEILLEWTVPQCIQYVVLQEYIALGQRVRQFEVQGWLQGRWQTLTQATTIGYKRILPIKPVMTDRIRICIQDARACPLLSAIEVY